MSIFTTAANEDFPRTTQNRTVAASDNINENFDLFVPFTDDEIDEDVEVFLVVVEARFPNGTYPTRPDGCLTETQPISSNIQFIDDGVTLALILDDDKSPGQCIKKLSGV